MPRDRFVRADGQTLQTLQTAQVIMDAVRSAYQAVPGAMLVSSVSLNPLEVVVIDGLSGSYYMVPVTTGADGSFNFGAPIATHGPVSPSVPAPAAGPNASRGLPARDQQRIAGAIARGAVMPEGGAFWAARAAAGHDIAILDHLAPLVIPGAGKVAAAASPGGDDYTRLFGSPSSESAEDGPEYRAMYGTPEEGQRAADAREVAAKNAIAALGDDQVYDRMFGKVSAAAPPVAVSASGPTGQHGRGEAGTRRYRVHDRRVSLRVPQASDDPAASAESAKTSWRLIDLRGGDLVPADAHPDDIKRLLHEKNQLGWPRIKPCS